MDQYADQFNEDQKVLMIEAYTDFPHTIEYYNYDVLPFNFGIIKNVTANSSAEYVKEEIDLYINSLPSGTIANWVLGNPDHPRVASRFPERLDQMTMLSMILPGIAVTYYGDEIGMVDEKDISCKDTQDPETCNAIISRTPEQTPFQWNATRNAGFSTANLTWLPVNSNYKELNLEKEMGVKNSHYDIYKDLAHLHGKEPALTEGSYRSFTTNNDQELPETMKLKVACSGSHSSLKQQVDIGNIYLPKKAAAVYTSLNIQ
ncbi:alpha-glucosidase [Camponotus japonicus]